MVEAPQTFGFLFKYKYRRKCSWCSPFLCSVIIFLLLFCLEVLSECSDQNCVNGVCRNDSCECFEGWQGTDCQYCSGKIRLKDSVGYITDGPGNYSVGIKCSWLISGDRPIRIRLEQFNTECGWDHLYIYDGDGVLSPVLAIYSGIIDSSWDLWSRQVMAVSNNALIHFFSDDAFSLPGFNISYAVGWCFSDNARTNCSDHGSCVDSVCVCETGWSGEACDQPTCPGGCSEMGVCEADGCHCFEGRAGRDCSRHTFLEWWEEAWPEANVRGRSGIAGHLMLTYNGTILRVGGESHEELQFSSPIVHELVNKSWDRQFRSLWDTFKLHGVEDSDAASPWRPVGNVHTAPRYAHAATIYKNSLLVYGGVVLDSWSHELSGRESRASKVTSELWILDLITLDWRNVTPPGFRVSGHTMVTVPMGDDFEVYTFFGHSPEMGYVATTRALRGDYDGPASNLYWETVHTTGVAARGGFGHTAVWDAHARAVLVHAGLLARSDSAQVASSALYAFDPVLKHWRRLSDSLYPRYLHTAVTAEPGLMMIIGGNVHNESGANSGCISSDVLLYSVKEDLWREIAALKLPPRAATAAVAIPAPLPPHFPACAVLVHGGYAGPLRSDGVLLSCGACPGRNSSACNARLECDYSNRTCGSTAACSMFTCSACVSAACDWCGRCHSKCPTHVSKVARKLEECDAEEPSEREHCGRLHSCAACHAHSLGCAWDYDSKRCRPHNSSHEKMSCGATCDALASCANCTREECIWCSTTMRCVDKNAYAASFPLGGCRAWTTSESCATSTQRGGCGALRSCVTCGSEAACGWCDLGLGNGAGVCLPSSRAHALCTKDRWYFGSCPLCQCNGHAVCTHGTGECVQPCSGRAIGAHCHVCAPLHHGDPSNGESCQPCACVGPARSCAPDSGRCHCAVKGLAGDKCDKCDTNNHYHPDPVNRNSCYYDLAIDYQFTFNLSKKEDRHLTAINFRNSPVKPDVDADFSIACSGQARMNLTVRTRRATREHTLLHEVNCTNFRYRFAKSEHPFGIEDNVSLTTFFVYVYDFKPPLWIQISFSQYPKLNLQQFFVTFSSCFLLLLLVAAALWKAKQRYDVHRRRQRFFIEMEQMASRAFAQVLLDVGEEDGIPSPVALEPCSGRGAAVLSALVRLPTGGTGRAPPHGGLALASALVALADSDARTH